MKSLNLFLSFSICIFIVTVTNTEGQIKVLSNGDIGIGSNSTGNDPSDKVEIKCDSDEKIVFNTEHVGTWGTANPKLLIEDYDLFTAIFQPASGNEGNLGRYGNSWTDTWTHTLHYNMLDDLSDKRVKNNIRDIRNPIDMINKLQGKQFDYNVKAFGVSSQKSLTASEQARLNKLLEEGKDQYGFIAQDVKNVLPELVSQDDSSGIYSVSTHSVIPILVEAFQQQQSTIDSLKSQINTIQTNCCSQTKSLKSTKTINSTEPTATDNAVQQASLDQNQPNPFTHQTEIDFYLPESITTATLYIYNMQGKQTDSYPVNQRGNGSISIAGGTLQPGMYMYTLIADGREVDTKRMILTE